MDKLSHPLKRRLLLVALTEAQELGAEEAHMKADRALIEYINDAEITAAFEALHKWYS